MVACAKRFRRRLVEAISAGSTPVRHPRVKLGAPELTRDRV